jgi:ABC-type transporter Mla subunit MlaD
MNRLADMYKESARLEGKASLGTEQLTKNIDDSSKALSDFSQSQNKTSEASDSLSTNLSDLGTGFDQAMDSANNLADSMTQNGGNMVDSFLQASDKSSDLGSSFDETGKSLQNFSRQLEKTTPPPSDRGTKDKEGTGSLKSIEKLLKKNFDELKAYAHAT